MQKKNQAKNNFTRVPDADPRAYFNRSTETLQDLNGTMQEPEKTRKELDQEVVMLLVALINVLGHDNRGNSPTKVLLRAAYGERGVLDRPNMRILRWRNGALSGSDVANEPGLGRSRTYEPGDMPQPTKPRPGLRRMHQDMNSEAASSSSQLRPAVPPKMARIEEVQTNETLQDLNGTMQELETTRKELDQVTKTMLSVEEDRDMWKRLFENWNKKQSEEIERLRREYKERSDSLALTDHSSRKCDTCKEFSSWAVPDGAHNAS